MILSGLGGYRSLSFLPEEQTSREPAYSSKRQTVRVAVNERTGRFFASIGGGHVWSGVGLDGLANELARSRTIDFAKLDVRPGDVYVRNGAGRSAKIEGTVPATRYQDSLGYGFKYLLTDAQAVVSNERGIKNDRIAAEQRRILAANHARQPPGTPQPVSRSRQDREDDYVPDQQERRRRWW